MDIVKFIIKYIVKISLFISSNDDIHVQEVEERESIFNYKKFLYKKNLI